MSEQSLPLDAFAATWRDQLIELDVPGLGPITASADPLLGETVPGPDQEELGFRRREPTAPPEPAEVRAALQARVPLVLDHTWLVLPALGPVLPTAAAEGPTVGDLGGGAAPFEVRAGPVRDAAPAGGGWYRLPLVAGALRRRAGMVARGALVGVGRDWFEPAVAAREDQLAVHPEQALETALHVAREQGQAAVLRMGPEGLDVVPTGADPRVPALRALPVLVTPRPPRCPLHGRDDAGACRPVGGPWIRRARQAQVDWTARRDQALGVLPCGVCFGEALPPGPDQPAVPRLSTRTPLPGLDRLHLRGGEVVRIDPLMPRR
ncbi:hypothetical protein [Brachybacterium sp. UNK5269]|uniref:hypothetical protein n=1 Tax=Brachybacterium sp. UNK5269 TaxID=3408576 RepID=UPI003BAEC09E